MYLLLVDYNSIPSEDLQEMINKAPVGTDVVNCISMDTLLKVTEKLTPDIVIVDFDLVKDSLEEIFLSLRQKSEQAYIIALIDAGSYDRLNEAIRVGGIDDYLIKPVKKDDFLARMHIAFTKKRVNREEHEEQEPEESDEARRQAMIRRVFAFDGEESVPSRNYSFYHEEQEAPSDPVASSGIEPLEPPETVDHPQTGKGKEFVPEAPAWPETHQSGQQGEGYDIPDSHLEIPPEDDRERSGRETELQQFETYRPWPAADGWSEPSRYPEPQPLDFDTSPAAGEPLTETRQPGESADDAIPPPSSTAWQPLTPGTPGSLASSSQGTSGDDLFSELQLTAGPEKSATGSDRVWSATDEQHPETPVEGWKTDLEKTSDGAGSFVGEDLRPGEFPGSQDPMPAMGLDELGLEPPALDDLFPDESTQKAPFAENLFEGPPENLTGRQDPASAPLEDPFAAFESEQQPLETLAFKAEAETKAQSVSPPPGDLYFEDIFGEEPPPPAVPEEKTAPPPPPPGSPQAASPMPPGSPGTISPQPPPPGSEVIPPRPVPGKKSPLPGKTADDFLYGESVPGSSGYNQDLLDDFLEDEGNAEAKSSRRKRKSRGGTGKFFSVVGNVVFVLLLLMMATLSFFLIQSRITGGVPQVAGYQMYIVLSGSMSPEFDTGSLAFVREIEPEQIVVGDIITFRSQADADSLTTHRVVSVNRDNGLNFTTRGDANNVDDPSPVQAENVVGRVTGSVPYLGYLMNFVQTRQGLILLIFVPGILIIAYELSKIVRYLAGDKEERGAERKQKGNRLADEGAD